MPDDEYLVLAILRDGAKQRRRCDNCGAAPVLTGYAHSAFQPFGGEKVWELMLLCEKCTLHALALSRKQEGTA